VESLTSHIHAVMTLVAIQSLSDGPEKAYLNFII